MDGQSESLDAETDERAARVRLRPLALEDAAFVAAETSRPEIARMTSRIPCPNPRLCAEGFILIMRAREQARGDRVRMIEHCERGARLGVMGLHPRSDGAWELGFWMARSAWGRGYATEAGALMLAEAAADGLGPVVAGHFEDNPASARVLRRLGFGYTGEVEQAWSLARAARSPCPRMALETA
ncbi:N-acetyltransferase [Marinicauda salina]|uniref:N-acetyltransferase n=1 Tax=Marinicauda salina TaxID=2135793 RepID=A0A2U2BX02_9PROT|nr:GNAT family N-acetyltransferase [Marinicauda salina]PWE18527.1 N-acetyltransferase [Marinicauda salina]